MTGKQTSWSMQLTLAELDTSAARVAKEVLQYDYFCLWLNGDIGAGKTSWVNSFLHVLGLKRDVVVTSPTYVHAREYKIAADIYNHADLYRLENIASFLALGFDSCRYRGEIYEWATPTNCCIPPTHKLNIDFTESSESRLYSFLVC